MKRQKQSRWIEFHEAIEADAAKGIPLSHSIARMIMSGRLLDGERKRLYVAHFSWKKRAGEYPCTTRPRRTPRNYARPTIEHLLAAGFTLDGISLMLYHTKMFPSVSLARCKVYSIFTKFRTTQQCPRNILRTPTADDMPRGWFPIMPPEKLVKTPKWKPSPPRPAPEVDFSCD